VNQRRGGTIQSCESATLREKMRNMTNIPKLRRRCGGGGAALLLLLPPLLPLLHTNKELKNSP